MSSSVSVAARRRSRSCGSGREGRRSRGETMLRKGNTAAALTAMSCRRMSLRSGSGALPEKSPVMPVCPAGLAEIVRPVDRTRPSEYTSKERLAPRMRCPCHEHSHSSVSGYGRPFCGPGGESARRCHAAANALDRSMAGGSASSARSHLAACASNSGIAARHTKSPEPPVGDLSSTIDERSSAWPSIRISGSARLHGWPLDVRGRLEPVVEALTRLTLTPASWWARARPARSPARILSAHVA